jgi:L-threonylcarbamoyladenylate synthase
MIRIKLGETRKDEAIHEAIQIVSRGGIIAYPTETFYGLGVRFDMPGSLRRLYELKRRPREKAMPVIIGHIDLLSELVSQKWLENIPSPVKSLMHRFWPGPLTLLLPAKEGLSEFLTAGSGMIAVRIPGESFALRIAKKAGFPITATSANLSGMPPAGTGREVTRYFDDRIDLLVDGGETAGGLPSTIVNAAEDPVSMVREGAIEWKEIEDYLVRSQADRDLRIDDYSFGKRKERQ